VGVITVYQSLYSGPAARDYIYLSMKYQQPYCTVEYLNQSYTYRVYDRVGTLMCYTTSHTVAQQFLNMANQGISSRVYYWLERWNWRIPKQYTDRS
jgi:hypothetical protein